uniref:Uncharacterized protein n=1 Tax=Arundo donax TaxID=35708 RepID=A0A0A8ZSL9_ARUDO
MHTPCVHKQTLAHEQVDMDI